MGEYSVQILAGERERYLVDVNDLEPIDRKEGLVRVVALASSGNMALVGINDVGKGKQFNFYVPQDDLIDDLKAIRK